MLSHHQKCCHTLKIVVTPSNSVVTPSRVRSHPQECCHTHKSAVTPSRVLSHPQEFCHTLKSVVTPSIVLSHPQECCHTLQSAATPSKLLSHLQKCCDNTKPHTHHTQTTHKPHTNMFLNAFLSHCRKYVLTSHASGRIYWNHCLTSSCWPWLCLELRAVFTCSRCRMLLVRIS